VVKTGKNKETNQDVAIKILRKARKDDDGGSEAAVVLANEIDIHTKLAHPNIIRLYEVRRYRLDCFNLLFSCITISFSSLKQKSACI